ncbi:unnamed protein product [Rotaria sordida]|uniref:Uncharacterized protein n=1 Tax=Rotaria sordida TaxID=392033 RepID=A0A819JDY2_9BILA|nr:unnamed protein product [Rotaria sordida]
MQHHRRRPPMTLSPIALNNNSNRPIRQTNRNMPSTMSQCFGCSQPMYNQYISNVLDHLWHPECVRCFVCRCLLNEQCYSREGKLYCKDDFIKKYIHRCFACQNLIKSDEFIRRIRTDRIYHAECFVCTKCKRTLQDNDISSLLKSGDTSFNDLDCLCQICSNPEKSSNEKILLSNTTNENKIIDNELSNTINGKISPSSDTQEQKSLTINNDMSTPIENHINEQQSMEIDEPPPSTTKPLISPIKEQPSSPSPSLPIPPKPNSRQSKTRQSTSSNGSKRSPAKAKATTATSRQKQTIVNERKGRSPATRSKSSTNTTTAPAATSSTVQRRSSNRRTTKTTRYRKRSFSSGSDDDETEDEEEDQDDADFAEENNIQADEQENTRSPVVKTKSSNNSDDKKSESESKPTDAPPPPPPPPPLPPPTTTTNPSLISQAKMSEPLSLLSGLAANPMSISSIMKPDLTPSFMPPNFNPAFPTPPQFLPPGFSLQSRLSMPSSTSLSNSQIQSALVTDSNSANASDTDSLDRSSSPSQMDISTNVEPGTPARPITPPKNSRQTTKTTTHKPSLNNTSTNEDKSSSSSIVVPETRPSKSRKRSTTNGEKKKSTTPRSNKKKPIEQIISTDVPISTENESITTMSSTDITPQISTTPESNKRRMSGTESEDFDEQQQQQPLQTTNGKSGNESDGSIDDGDRSLNTIPSISSTAAEKKGARTTIKPQQLEILCKAFETCSKPNKTEREQLVAETGLTLRVIQVWFQNKRSKERKGKTSKEKETPLDDDELADDSQSSPPPTTSESTPPITNTEV